jgi:hypothetical protein
MFFFPSPLFHMVFFFFLQIWVFKYILVYFCTISMFVNILLKRKGMIIGECHKDNFMVNKTRK